MLYWAYARQYFAGEQSTAPVWEILSNRKAKTVVDITDYLHSGENHGNTGN